MLSAFLDEILARVVPWKNPRNCFRIKVNVRSYPKVGIMSFQVNHPFEREMAWSYILDLL